MVSASVPCTSELFSAVFVVLDTLAALPALKPVAVVDYLACLTVFLAFAVESVVPEAACVNKGFACIIIVAALYKVIVALGIFLAEAAEPALSPFALIFYVKAVYENSVAVGFP